ncbi:SRPBCC family protein [Luteipulveratus mongoliensis]|nr:hypothetical protein [Luteipulveratus mongoliensis]
MTNWPVAELNSVQRLRALAAGVSGAIVLERVVDAGVDDVWAILADFEHGFTMVQPDMRSVEIEARDGDSVTLVARSHYGMRARLRGIARPGYCWLQSRFLVIAMAAAPEPGGGTRVALTGGVRVPGRAAIVPVGVRRELRVSLDRLEGLLGT